MTREALDALWNDPAHWDRDGSYRCAADPRLVVSKRGGGGWTMNMAHPKAQVAIWTFFGAVITIVVIVGIVAARR